KISQAGELRGISEIGSGRLLIVKPYGLTGLNHLPQAATSAGLAPGTSALHTGGVDVKVGLRDNLVANFTGNTDFADADVDTQQFNLTPYQLFFPEKRFASLAAANPMQLYEHRFAIRTPAHGDPETGRASHVTSEGVD